MGYFKKLIIHIASYKNTLFISNFYKSLHNRVLNYAAILLQILILSTPLNALQKTTICLKWHNQFQFAGYYAADIKGYFAEEGLEITLKNPKNNVLPVESVLRGDGEYGISTGDLLTARVSGKPVVIVGVIFQHSPIILLSKKSNEYNFLSDFIGKKVMSSVDDLPEIKAMFQKEGIDPNLINFINHSGRLEQLINDNIAATVDYISNEPNLLRELGIEPSIIQPIDYGVDFYADALFTTEKEVRNNSKRVESIQRAVFKGWRYALENQEEIIDYILSMPDVKKRGVTKEHLWFEATEIYKLVQPRLVEVGHINPLRWEKMAEAYSRFGLIDSNYSLKGFIYSSDNSTRSKVVLYTLFATLIFIIIAGILVLLWNQQLYLTVNKKTHELFESQSYLLSVLDACNDGIAVVDIQTGLILDVNRTMEELFLYDTNLINKLNINDLLLLVDDNGSTFLEQFLSNKFMKNSLIQCISKKKNDEKFDSEISVRYMNLETRDKAVVVIRNISERKEAHLKLMSEKNRLFVTLRSIADGVISTDKDGIILILNNAAELITGYKQDEAVGNFIHTIFPVFNEIAGTNLINPVERVLMSSQHNVVVQNSTLINKNGEKKIITATASAILNQENVLTGAVLVFQDITEKQKLLDSIQRSQKLESLGILAGGIAHDFNNLLAGIFGYINLAELKTTDTIVSKYLKRSGDAINRAKNLTQQLLTFAKGGEPIKKSQKLDICIIEAVTFALSGSATEAMFFIKDDLPMVDFDKEQLSQVIDNLIINAKQSMNDSGIVSISASNYIITEHNFPLPAGRYVRISIADNGVGISPKNINNIFDPFFTTKSSGHGLGLAMCYSIIRKHQGLIEVESTEGKGTTFYITLPVSSIEEQVNLTKYKSLPNMDGKGDRVLVMDDDPLIRDILFSLLNHLGYEVKTTGNGAEAIKEYFEALDINKRFDIVIFDLTVQGGMGGKEALSEILKKDPLVKALVTSGYSSDPVLADPTASGFVAAIPKPFTLEQLRDILYKNT